MSPQQGHRRRKAQTTATKQLTLAAAWAKGGARRAGEGDAQGKRRATGQPRTETGRAGSQTHAAHEDGREGADTSSGDEGAVAEGAQRGTKAQRRDPGEEQAAVAAIEAGEHGCGDGDGTRGEENGGAGTRAQHDQQSHRQPTTQATSDLSEPEPD